MVNITEHCTRSSRKNTKVRIKMKETNTTKEKKILFRDYISLFFKKTRKTTENYNII